MKTGKELHRKLVEGMTQITMDYLMSMSGNGRRIDNDKTFEDKIVNDEMIKLKKAISSSRSPSNAPTLSYKDYSSSIAKINSPVINANENIKDTLAKDSGLQSLVSKASSQSTIGNAKD